MLRKWLGARIGAEQARAAYEAAWGKQDALLFQSVPSQMHASFHRWVCWGLPPGDFLQAVISNDLFGAAALADDHNRHALWIWVRLFHNACPASCFGSQARMIEWNKKGGMLGACIECGRPLYVPGQAESDQGRVCNCCKECSEKIQPEG